VYLGFVHVFDWKIPKEIAAAGLFTAGTFIAAWSALPCPELAWAAAAFFVLCLANIVAIECWEDASTAWLARNYMIWVPAVAVLCLVGKSEWYVSIAISAAACILLFTAGRRISVEARRVLVDGALLTPIAFLMLR
jgi:putative effector of murein hydrolase LrgA (UPF0299 family)